MYEPDGRTAVFLAGGISGCPDWQAEACALLAHLPITVLNPRRANFPIDDPSAAASQIRWEYEHLRAADVVVFWFPDSGPVTQPIALFELGAHATAGKPLVVGCDPSYVRRDDVVYQLGLARPELTVHSDLRSVCFQVRQHLLAAGWDAAAAGYERYFVPRFAPWVAAAVDALGVLPSGPILVPCCGTFPELPLLLERYPDRSVVGIDLSSGMTALARSRARGLSNVRVVTGDASALDPSWTGRCAAVLSVFGLQQLPDPPSALESWRAALAPGGKLSVVYWPGVTEADGPFALLASLRGGGGGPYPWESGEFLSFPMTHPSAETFFDEYVHNGPLRSSPGAVGLRSEFLRRAPSGSWTHHPRARLVVR
jgi:SAM-dependent methyltransferase